jgi:heme oxygenase
VDAAELPTCLDLPRLETAAEVLGSMYVLEGATLGGRFVARHLECILGLSDGLGYSFFRPYGEELGRMWQAFGEVISAHSSPEADPAIIASAVETFESLGRWLRGGAA